MTAKPRASRTAGGVELPEPAPAAKGSKILAALRKLFAPFSALAQGHEPVYVGYVIAAGLSFGAHYGFHLNAYQQTVFVAVVTALVHWAVRSLVTPVAKQAEGD